MRTESKLKRLVLAAMFLALAFVLPFFTGQIPQIGKMLCPMHLPVLLCGFVCGPGWGLAVGFLAPLLRSVTMGVPAFYPNALCMAFELAVYGGVAGLLHGLLPRGRGCAYLSLLAAMLAGRLIWGGTMFLCLGLSGSRFGMEAFLAGAFLQALPGILLQILLIPPVVILLDGRRKSAHE